VLPREGAASVDPPDSRFSPGRNSHDGFRRRHRSRDILAATSSSSDAVFTAAVGTEANLSGLADMLNRGMGVTDLKPELVGARKATSVWGRLADTDNAQCYIGSKAQVSLEDGLQPVPWWSQQTNTPVKALQTSMPR
jgi:hypothetical protein